MCLPLSEQKDMTIWLYLQYRSPSSAGLTWWNYLNEAQTNATFFKKVQEFLRSAIWKMELNAIIKLYCNYSIYACMQQPV